MQDSKALGTLLSWFDPRGAQEPLVENNSAF